MSAPSKTMLRSILTHLGYDVPSDTEIMMALHRAFRELSEAETGDANSKRFKLIVPIDAGWIRDVADSSGTAVRRSGDVRP